MIKINLATRKRAVGTADDRGGGGGGLGGQLSMGKVQEAISGLPVTKIATFILLGFVASYGLDWYEGQILDQRSAVLNKLLSDQTRLKTELNKTKGYEEMKKQLDADELVVKTKLDTIQTLIAERQIPEKMLLTVSNGIPTDVWLSEIFITKDKVDIKGFALGFSQISDFMKNMTETEYYRDLRLQSTQDSQDDTGTDVAMFDMGLKKAPEGKKK